MPSQPRNREKESARWAGSHQSRGRSQAWGGREHGRLKALWACCKLSSPRYTSTRATAQRGKPCSHVFLSDLLFQLQFFVTEEVGPRQCFETVTRKRRRQSQETHRWHGAALPEPNFRCRMTTANVRRWGNHHKQLPPRASYSSSACRTADQV